MIIIKSEYKRVVEIVICIAVISTIFISIYNIRNNKTIDTVYQDIQIDNLPKEFVDFKILQISDLHGKIFGEKQKYLVDIINSIDYDAIAITGDMGNEKHTDDITPFIDMLDGIKNKEYIFYVRGNNGPEVIDEETGEITDMGRLLIDKGCKILKEPFPIEKGNNTLWVSRYLNNKEYDEFNVDIGKDDLRMVVAHYPMDKRFYEGIAQNELPDYDLILTGHHHGGQYRIPFLGALFIPDVNGNRFFPEEERVKGLTTWGGFNQYVSAGLGASANMKFLQFRLFNKPEVNLITLVNK